VGDIKLPDLGPVYQLGKVFLQHRCTVLKICTGIQLQVVSIEHTRTLFVKQFSSCEFTFAKNIDVMSNSVVLLANVNSRSRSLYAIARPFVRPTQAVQVFNIYFYGIRHLGHPLKCTENFTEIVPGEPLRRGS